jgi:hypothetical protein
MVICNLKRQACHIKFKVHGRPLYKSYKTFAMRLPSCPGVSDECF